MYKYDERLIELVSKKVLLYDKRDRSYRNVILKTKMWKEIADQLKINVEIVKKRWASLRDMFMRELKIRKLEQLKFSRTGVIKKRKTFKYFDSLHFLKDVYTPRNFGRTNDFEQSNTTAFDEVQEEGKDVKLYTEEDYHVQETSNIELMLPVSPQPSTSTMHRQRTPSRNSTIEESNLEEEMLKMVKQLRSEHPKQDDIGAFVRNLELLMRQADLSINEKLEIEIRTLNLVQEVINRKN